MCRDSQSSTGTPQLQHSHSKWNVCMMRAGYGMSKQGARCRQPHLACVRLVGKVR